MAEGIRFEPAPESRSQMRVVGLGFTDSPESVRMRAFSEWGNTFRLQKIQERFVLSVT